MTSPDKPGSRAIVVSTGTNATTTEVVIGGIKAALGAVPFVGPALNEALFDIRSRIQQRRVNELVANVSRAVAALGEDKLDHDYIGSEEFSDVISDVVVRTARTRSEQKRLRFSQILVGAMLGRRDSDFDAIFRKLVEDLSDDEVILLGHFAPAHEVAANATSWQMPLIEKLDYSQPTLLKHRPLVTRQLIQNLIRRGLLFDDSHGRMDTPPYAIVMPTDLGAHFYEIQVLPPLAGEAPTEEK